MFPAGQKEDQFAVALYLYAELLRDETSRTDLVGPTLPLLKALCDRAYSARLPESHTYARVLHGLLSACILHVDEMRFVLILCSLFVLSQLIGLVPPPSPEVAPDLRSTSRSRTTSLP